MLTIGIIGSTIFLLFGYWISGAFPSVTDAEGNTAGFGVRLLNVLAHPLQTKYNQYTPIVMLLFFVIFELLFFVLLVVLKNKSEENSENDATVEMAPSAIQDIEKTSKSMTEIEPEEDKTSISEDLFMELNGTYSMEQIAEMMKISKYIETVSAALLVKMFKPNMTAEEIRSYIEMFYG